MRQPIALTHGFGEQETERALERGIGGAGQGPRHLGDGPDPSEVGERGQERDLGFEDAKRPHRLRSRSGRGEIVIEAGREGERVHLWGGRKASLQAPHVALDEPLEIRRSGERARQ